MESCAHVDYVIGHMCAHVTSKVWKCPCPGWLLSLQSLFMPWYRSVFKACC